MRKIGYVFVVLGYISWFVFGLWGFIIELNIVYHIAGFWGIALGLTLLPVTFFIVPIYVLIAYGSWFPILIGYGGGFLGLLLRFIGTVISGDDT